MNRNFDLLMMPKATRGAASIAREGSTAIDVVTGKTLIAVGNVWVELDPETQLPIPAVEVTPFDFVAVYNEAKQ